MPVDPCAELERMRERRRELASSGGEKRIRFGQEETEYHAPNLAALDREIARLERECDAAQGLTPRRARFAKVMRFTR